MLARSRPSCPKLAPVVACFVLACGHVRSPGQEVSFSREVAPLLARHCLTCHGKDEPQSGYSLISFAALQKSGAAEKPPVVPGKPDESHLLSLVGATDPAERMPQDADPLPAADIELLRRWVTEGAKFDGPDPEAGFETLLPLTRHPDSPSVYARPVPITALAFSPDGAELAVSGQHEITVWSVPDGKLLSRIGNVAERTLGVAYSIDGQSLLSAGGSAARSGEVRVFRRADGGLLGELDRLTETALDLALSPAGDRLAVAAADRSLRVYNLATGARTLLIEDHADWVLDVAWNADGQRLATASRDKTVKVFSATDGELLATYPGHADIAFGVSFLADVAKMASVGRDRRIHIWNVADGAKASEVAGFGGDVLGLLRRGDELLTCGADHIIRIHRVDNGQLVRALEGHADWVYRLAIDEPRGRLASGGYDGQVRIWNLADGQLVGSFIAAPQVAVAR